MDAIVAGIAGKLLKKGGEKAVKKAVDKTIKYLKDDQERSYALEERVEIVLKQEDACATSAWLWLHAPDDAIKWTTADGSLEIDWSQYSLGLRLAANPFPASSHLWNGPDVIGDCNFAAMFASLFHDLIWGHADEIAKAFDVPREGVLRWGDAVLYAIWHTVEPGIMSRLAYGVCEFAVPWYHRVKRLLGFGCAALAFAGCAAFNPPNITLVEATGTNAIARAMQSSPAESDTGSGGGLVHVSSWENSAGDLSAYPLGLASCWGGANASQRMMNILSPRMDDATFKARLDFMASRGCTAAHLILANGGDGEAAGYAAWRDSDRPAMLARLNAVKAAGFAPVPWIITDDSDALRAELFRDATEKVAAMKDFFDSAPYVVLGLEMDEGGATAGDWTRVRDALRKVYDGPIGTHHCSGNDFPFASLGDIVLGQLEPGCTEAQVAAQIKAIKAKGKRAVGFEYSRSPNRNLSLAALNAGAEGVGNWDGGGLPSTSEKEGGAAGLSDDEVDFGTLDWCYGGFRGGGATPADGCRIKDLKVGGGKMSYAWKEGDCKPLGEKAYGDAKCLACLFCRDASGNWRGGKFEWVGTSRTSRSLGNCDGYGGWKMSDVNNATQYAFVIVSEDGRKRSNVITCGR